MAIRQRDAGVVREPQAGRRATLEPRGIPRTRGLLSGLLLLILGVWGGIVPFIGPYFHYSIGSTTAWTWTTNRLWLDVLPGVAVALGGLILMSARTRGSAWMGGWLALIGGLWFAIGTPVSMLWEHGQAAGIGAPAGSNGMRVIEQIGYFYGLGAVITALSAFALGRFAVRAAEDAALAPVAAERPRARPLPGRAGSPVAPGSPAAARGATGPGTASEDETVVNRPTGDQPAPLQRPGAAADEPPADRRA